MSASDTPLPITTTDLPGSIVYFIVEFPFEGFCRIGCTTNLRLRDIQRGNPRKLRLLTYIPSKQEREKDLKKILHEVLYEQRIEGSDWFRFGSETEILAIANLIRSSGRFVECLEAFAKDSTGTMATFLPSVSSTTSLASSTSVSSENPTTTTLGEKIRKAQLEELVSMCKKQLSGQSSDAAVELQTFLSNLSRQNAFTTTDYRSLEELLDNVNIEKSERELIERQASAACFFSRRRLTQVQLDALKQELSLEGVMFVRSTPKGTLHIGLKSITSEKKEELVERIHHLVPDFEVVLSFSVKIDEQYEACDALLTSSIALHKGTFGVCVHTNSDEHYALTAKHVLEETDHMHHNLPYLCPLDHTTELCSPLLDVAAVRMEAVTPHHSSFHVSDHDGNSLPAEGCVVIKHGARTGITIGKYLGYSEDEYCHQVEWFPGLDFARKGDSGSLCVYLDQQNEESRLLPLGIHFKTLRYEIEGSSRIVSCNTDWQDVMDWLEFKLRKKLSICGTSGCLTALTVANNFDHTPEHDVSKG